MFGIGYPHLLEMTPGEVSGVLARINERTLGDYSAGEMAV